MRRESRRAPWIVAFSGGTDSLALALELRAFARVEPAPEIRLVHVDHGLHPDSAQWALDARRLADEVGFQCQVIRVAVDTANGVEDAARRARYGALRAVLEPGGAVLTAHHQNDQAETVLLRLLRGAGVEGLGAMPAVRPLGVGWLLRPLLEVPRNDLVDLVAASGLTPIEDPANADGRYDRSFLRTEVMPLLRARWPAADRVLARSASFHRQSARQIAEVAGALKDDVAGAQPGTLSRRRLTGLTADKAALVLRHWFAEHDLRPIPAKRLETLVTQLCRPGGAPRCAVDGAHVVCYRDAVHLVRERGVAPPLPAHWRTTDGLALAHGTLRVTAAAGAGLSQLWCERHAPSLAYRADGDRCVMHDGRRHQSMKKVFQTLGVPPWERDQWPLVKVGDDVVAIPGRYLSRAFAAAPGEPGWLLDWQWH